MASGQGKLDLGFFCASVPLSHCAPFTSCDTRTAKSCNGFLEDVRLPLLQTAFSGLAAKAGFRNKASTPYVRDVLECGQASLVEARRCVTLLCSELKPWLRKFAQPAA
eukprot:s2396_g4.t1